MSTHCTYIYSTSCPTTVLSWTLRLVQTVNVHNTYKTVFVSTEHTDCLSLVGRSPKDVRTIPSLCIAVKAKGLGEGRGRYTLIWFGSLLQNDWPRTKPQHCSPLHSNTGTFFTAFASRQLFTLASKLIAFF